MRVKIWCAGLLLVALGDARDALADGGYEACINRTASNPEWNACGQQEIARQEARLNGAWKKALACFDTTSPTGRDAKESFIDEEKIWAKWKDRACGFYFPRTGRDDSFGFAGREGQVLGAPQCKIAIIRDRAAWLESFSRDCQ